MPEDTGTSTAKLLQLGLRHHQAGEPAEAEKYYQQVLHIEPGNADALNFSGILAHQRGESALASSFIGRAIESAPRNAGYRFNLGMVLEATGQLNEAIEHYRQAGALDPELQLTHFRLGNALWKQGRYHEAAVSYSRELRLNPQSHEAINNLGGALEKLGRHEQAMVCYQKAISLHSGFADAHNNLGIVLQKLRRLDEAVASFGLAILHRPAFADAYSNMANALTLQSRFEEAVQLCKRAIELEPDHAEAHVHLGNAYKQLGLFNEAVASYQRAISLTADHGGAYCNLAEVFKDQGKLQLADECFKKSIAARPLFLPAYSALLYFYAFTRYVSPAEERIVAKGWEEHMLTESERAAARARACAMTGAFPVRPRAGRKLRLGILTAELGFPGVCDFLEPLLNKLDRSRFELTMFPTHLSRLQSARAFADQKGDGFVALGPEMPAAEAAQRIRLENIDVLIETTGHTYNSRLDIIAHRAAPVQCSYIGYWSTTGLTEMDWFITGTGVSPAIGIHFSERLWKLPRQSFCYQGNPEFRDDVWTPDPDGTIWLGSFNNNAKIRQETLGLWAKVLHGLPEAKLLFEDRQTQDEQTHQRLTSTLQKFGVDASRIHFIPHIHGHARHMSLFPRLDIALDTIPFNSVTTAFDSLWMGVPLITMAGNWLGGSIAASILRSFGRAEWIAESDEEYVSIVCTLARDVEKRKQLRRNQRALMAGSELCDANGVARCLEDAFEAMYDDWSGRSAN